MPNGLEKLSDEELVGKMKQSNGDSGKYFNVLYNKYNELVYNRSFFLLKDKEEALDNAQDVFEKVYLNIHNFEGSSLASWIYKIASNSAINKIRKAEFNVFNFSEYFKYLEDDMNEEEFFAKFLDLYDSPEEEKIKKDRNEKISESLDNLKTRGIDFGKFLNMYYFQDKKYKDIEKETGLPINTVKSRIRRGKQLLEPKISEYNPLS
jgi:RNA polymerase sigma-70 factor, ECF subfamily